VRVVRRNPLVGYCQGMNLLAAALILVLEEEDAFWCFVNIVEKTLPPNYFTSNLLVSQADQRCVHRAHERVDKTFTHRATRTTVRRASH